MAVCTSFPPIARRDAVVLILGSMPGRESLAQQQYYAHPRNAFWYIMGTLFGAGPSEAYRERKRLLCNRRVAVWDVLRHCDRSGSLDAAIVPATEIANDFETFFRRHSALRAVFFNGRKAEAAFHRHVQPAVSNAVANLALETLPSTSPAYAALSWEEKLRAWRRVLDSLASESSTVA